MESEIIKLKTIVSAIEKNSIIDDGTWLDHLNSSQAFLTCIGAGPWKVNRRNFLQKQAITNLGALDLSEVRNVSLFKFPLDWQNQKIENLINHLNAISYNMEQFTDKLKKAPNSVEILYSVTKTKGRAKVLDLFARDYLKTISFPIDRHVEKMLRDNEFPVNEKYMIELCQAAGLNPSRVARVFVSGSGKFTGNGKI